MKKYLYTLLLALGLSGVMAQEAGTGTFYIEVSTDSLLMDNMLKVTFRLENAKGAEFAPPSFAGFAIVGGPNQSSSVSIMNGAVSQTVSYTYYLEPLAVGNYYLDPAAIKVGDQYLETAPQKIMVVPNPEGIRQEIPESGDDPRSRFFGDWPMLQRPMAPPPPDSLQMPPAKKRKTTRI